MLCLLRRMGSPVVSQGPQTHSQCLWRMVWTEPKKSFPFPPAALSQNLHSVISQSRSQLSGGDVNVFLLFIVRYDKAESVRMSFKDADNKFCLRGEVFEFHFVS